MLTRWTWSRCYKYHCQGVVNVVQTHFWDGSSGFLVSTVFGFIFCCDLWCGQPNYSPNFNFSSWNAQVNIFNFPKEETRYFQWELKGYQSEFSFLYGFDSLSSLPGLSPHLFFSSLQFAVVVLLCLLKPCPSWWPQLCFYFKFI